MTTVLSEAIDQAQQALEGGDHRSAAETCAHILEQYPNCVAAQRLLGLASLHQGKTAEAERAFGRVLAADPRDPDAYFGLGVIAEERGVLENALAYCQVAWELAPTMPTYRETVERVAGKRYGPDGYLQFTHAALAELHVTNQRLTRAIREYQTALGTLPERVDLWMGLAESLWRLGQDDDAAEISREFLKERPELARALVILADIEFRQGNTDAAEEYRERYRRLDQDGRLVAAMLTENPHAAADFLRLPEDQIPQLDPRADHVIAERPTIAPAPDFTVQPEESAPAADIEDLEPIDAEEFAGEDVQTEDGPPASYPEPQITQQLPEIDAEQDSPADQAGGMDDLLAELERVDSEPATPEPPPAGYGDVADDIPEEPPVDAPASDAEAAELSAALGDTEPAPASDAESGGYEDLAAQFDDQSDALPIDVDDDEMAGLLAEFEGIEPMRPEDFGATEDEIENLGSGMFQDAEIDFDMRIEDADAVQIGGGPPAHAPSAFSSPSTDFPEEDHLEPEEFPEFPDVEAEDGSEEQAVEAQPAEEAAPPPPPPAPQQGVPSGTGFTRLLGELGEEGLAPFDPARTADEQPIVHEQRASSEEQQEEDPFANLADTWDDVDREIEDAIPTRPAQTDELGDLAELDIEPFQLDDEDDDDESLVHEAPATRHIGADELASMPEPEDQVVEPAAQEAVSSEDEEFEGIEPFTYEDFDTGDDEAEGGYSFSQQRPWDRSGDDSALPSDEALEAMLGGDTGSSQDLDEDIEPEAESAGDVEPADVEDFTAPDQELDPSLAVTRELGGEDQQIDPELEERMAEMEAAAADHLGQYEDIDDDSFFGAPTAPFHAQSNAPEAEEPAAEIDQPEAPAVPETDVFPQTDADRLVRDQGLFERSRAAKSDLVNEGVIRGDRELEGEAAEEPAPEPVAEQQHDEFVAEQPAEEAEFEVRTGATGDIGTLRASLQADPHDPELHWWLAEALRKSGEIHEAFDEYRWLIREAPARHRDVIASLTACADAGQEEELAHRLMADVYRRMGDSHQARTHASLALAARRRRR